MFLDTLPNLVELAVGQALVPGQLDLRFDPEFRLSIGTGYMHMNPLFFPREEQESIVFISQDRRTHEWIIPEALRKGKGLGPRSTGQAASVQNRDAVL